MNARGHVATLVPAHPGNANAVKNGVYSQASQAPRILELDDAIAARPAGDVYVDVLRRELASLIAICEAIDASLATEGIVGRGGNPRAMLSLRLRVHDKLARTAGLYGEAARNRADRAPAAATGADEVPEGEPPDLLTEIAYDQLRESLAEVTPETFNPDAFLRTLVASVIPR